MTQLRRNRFAFFVNAIFTKFEEIRRKNHLLFPEIIRQPAYLGYGESAEIKDAPELNAENCTLSHVVYFTLQKQKYDFDNNGFSEIIKGNRLQFQGDALRRAINAHINGQEIISLSDKYFAAYLFFLGWTERDLETKFSSSSNSSLEINIPWTARPPKINRGEVFPLEHDIFLASPKLTLAHKIKITYGTFRKIVKMALGKNFTNRIENILIKHFFGFVPIDLDKECDLFEEYLTKLKSELEKKGFKVYDSREDITLDDIDGIGHSPTQLKKDINAIKRSKTYILVSPYPRLFSSAWVEAGVAISLGKPCKFICSDRITDLPFVLQEGGSQMDFDVVEYRGMTTTSLSNRIKYTIKFITEWSPFRCSTCFGTAGAKGYVGKKLCSSCKGKGFFTTQ